MWRDRRAAHTQQRQRTAGAVTALATTHSPSAHRTRYTALGLQCYRYVTCVGRASHPATWHGVAKSTTQAHAATGHTESDICIAQHTHTHSHTHTRVQRLCLYRWFTDACACVCSVAWLTEDTSFTPELAWHHACVCSAVLSNKLPCVHLRRWPCNTHTHTHTHTQRQCVCVHAGVRWYLLQTSHVCAWWPG